MVNICSWGSFAPPLFSSHSHAHLAHKPHTEVQKKRIFFPLCNVPDQTADFLTLGNELGSVEAGNFGLEDFVHDGGQDTVIHVCAEVSVDGWELVNLGTAEHTQGDVDHLQVLCSGEGSDALRLCANVVDDGALQPWDAEVKPFSQHNVVHTAQAAVNDGTVTTLDCLIEEKREKGKEGRKGGQRGGERAGKEKVWGKRKWEGGKKG